MRRTKQLAPGCTFLPCRVSVPCSELDIRSLQHKCNILEGRSPKLVMFRTQPDMQENDKNELSPEVSHQPGKLYMLCFRPTSMFPRCSSMLMIHPGTEEQSNWQKPTRKPVPSSNGSSQIVQLSLLTPKNDSSGNCCEDFQQNFSCLHWTTRRQVLSYLLTCRADQAKSWACSGIVTRRTWLLTVSTSGTVVAFWTQWAGHIWNKARYI